VLRDLGRHNIVRINTFDAATDAIRVDAYNKGLRAGYAVGPHFQLRQRSRTSVKYASSLEPCDQAIRLGVPQTHVKIMPRHWQMLFSPTFRLIRTRMRSRESSWPHWRPPWLLDANRRYTRRRQYRQQPTHHSVSTLRPGDMFPLVQLRDGLHAPSMRPTSVPRTPRCAPRLIHRGSPGRSHAGGELPGNGWIALATPLAEGGRLPNNATIAPRGLSLWRSTCHQMRGKSAIITRRLAGIQAPESPGPARSSQPRQVGRFPTPRSHPALRLGRQPAAQCRLRNRNGAPLKRSAPGPNSWPFLIC
jgi:hypothetical protein